MLFYGEVMNCSISIAKYLRYQYGVIPVIVHLRNSNKQ